MHHESTVTYYVLLVVICNLFRIPWEICIVLEFFQCRRACTIIKLAVMRVPMRIINYDILIANIVKKNQISLSIHLKIRMTSECIGIFSIS